MYPKSSYASSNTFVKFELFVLLINNDLGFVKSLILIQSILSTTYNIHIDFVHCYKDAFAFSVSLFKVIVVETKKKV